MAGGQEPKKESGRKREFITEKVVKPPISKGQMFKKCLLLVLAAILFGVVAAVSFVISQPWAARYLGEPAAETERVSIPKDEVSVPAEEESSADASETSGEQESSLASSEEGMTEAAEEESVPVEQLVRSAMENYHYSVNDLNSLFNSLRTEAQKAGKSIVVVHSVQQQLDWFDNPVETTGYYAGAVIAATPQELLILTPEAAVEQADAIQVTFPNGTEVAGRKKQQDTLTGMAIVSVNAAELSEDGKEPVQPLALGNSYLIREGDLIVAVGSPAGKDHSVDYGFVSYISRNVQMVDLVTHVFHTRVSADAGRGTFFINTAGELIGWATQLQEGDTDLTEIMGISDYKGILEKLTNGLGAPCLGIEWQEVPEEMTAQGMPEGIYVLDSVSGRPAYLAGIQSGDIITAVDSRKLQSQRDFQGMMDALECGQLIHVTVQRNGRDQYTELEFPVTVGAR